MYQRLCFLFFLLLFCFVHTQAQTTTRQLSGEVLQATGTPIAAAVVEFSGPPSTKILTDSSGRFSVSLQAGPQRVTISHVGFKTQRLNLNLQSDTTFSLMLPTDAKTLQEVVITASDNRGRVTSLQTSVETVDRKTALMLPAILGEVDVIKVFQLKPGVKNSGEGTSGLSVRGGGTDQNLFLLDGTPVYNPAHLFGFFSTFNIDAIRDVQLYKAGFPAEFSGRLSSIVDVNTMRGTDSAFSVGGGIGLISTRLNLQGNVLRKNEKGRKLNYNIAARRTYADVFTRIVNEANKNDPEYNPIPTYYFYDVNARIDYAASDKDVFFASLYRGRDNFKFDSDVFGSRFSWGNTAASLHWRRQVSPVLSSALSAHLSDYNYALNSSFDRFNFRLGSGVQEYSLAHKFLYRGLSGHRLSAGYSVGYNRFSISKFNINSAQPSENLSSGEDLDGVEGGVFLADEWTLSPTLSINAGARFTLFRNAVTYTGFEPRLSIRQMLSNQFSVKASYSRMQQYKHLVVSSGASLPTDIWYPSTAGIRPEVSDQVALSFTWNKDNQWLVTNETYYKWMRRLVDYRPGANLFVNSSLEEEFVYGNGAGYGNEITIEKTGGRLRGWIGYTLAWTTRSFADINEGRSFFPRYDRRHELTAVATYPLSRRITLSGSWTFYTGNAVSLPTGRIIRVDAPGTRRPNTLYSFSPVYPERGNYRMPNYHRLDLGMVYQLRTKKGRSADLTISAYNAYSRLNPYFISFERERNGETQPGIPRAYVAKAVTLFPIIPSITYNFKF